MSRVTFEIFTNCFTKTASACWGFFPISSFKKWGYILKLIPSFMLLALTACASPMVGKLLPEGNYQSFTNGIKGHHYIPLYGGFAELDYDWHINAEDNTLNLKGHYEILPGKWEFKYPLKTIYLTIEAYVLNGSYEIVEVEYIYHVLYEDQDFGKKQIIDKTFPYKQEYKYIDFKLSYEGDYYSH